MPTATNSVSPGVQDTINRLNTPGNLRSENPLATLDQTDFLTLLTTQLTQQDPLEPASNEEMLAQMAQFSSLEAQIGTSSTLERISEQLDTLIATQEATTAAATAAAEAATQAAQDAARAAAAVTGTPTGSSLSQMATAL